MPTHLLLAFELLQEEFLGATLSGSWAPLFLAGRQTTRVIFGQTDNARLLTHFPPAESE